jgi:glutamyl-tRNA reductase
MAADLIVVGLSYRTAPLEIREKLAFPDGELEPALRGLMALPSLGEAVLLSTCNRVEVYASTRSDLPGPGSPSAVGEIRRFLSNSRGVSAELLSAHLYERTGRAAIEHVFRVASSLDSLVVGESQILGQLKSAYGASSQAGTVGPLLGRCLERAFGVAKRVRSETAIARGAANVSSVAVELAKRIFGDLGGKLVLVVGAGKMSDLAARHLRADGAADILVINRSPEKAEELAHKVDGHARPWDDLDKLLGLADVVISSTGSREPIITRAIMKQVMKARRHKSIFLIDIAVPRDVEAAVGKLENVFLYDIDDLERVVADNRAERQKEAAAGGKIAELEASQFFAWLRSQGAVPTIKDLRERFRQVAQAEAERTVAALGGKLDAKGEEQIRYMADAIVNKLLHTPSMTLKHGDGEDLEALVVATRKLFALTGGGAGGAGGEQP